MDKENSKDKNFNIFNSIKIQTLIKDPLMLSEWYKDPHVSCVFKSIDNKNFIFYPRSDFTVKGYEFIYSNSEKNFVIIENENCLLKGFTNSITLIKHYVLDIDQLNINDFILSGCENKLTLWKYSKTNDIYYWELFLTINTFGGFIYNSIIFEYEGNYQIAIASFTEDYPVMIYDLNCDMIREIPYKGKCFYLDVYEKNPKECNLYLIITNWSGDLSVYDYINNKFIMNKKLKGNLKNLFIYNLEQSNNDKESTLVTILDWKGRLIEMNLFSGEILRESKILYGNSPALCRYDCFNYEFPEYFLIQGKKKSLELLNSNNWESIYSIEKLHGGKLIINIWNFNIHDLGNIIITYGFDKCIKILYR